MFHSNGSLVIAIKTKTECYTSRCRHVVSLVHCIKNYINTNFKGPLGLL